MALHDDVEYCDSSQGRRSRAYVVCDGYVAHGLFEATSQGFDWKGEVDRRLPQKGVQFRLLLLTHSSVSLVGGGSYDVSSTADACHAAELAGRPRMGTLQSRSSMPHQIQPTRWGSKDLLPSC